MNPNTSIENNLQCTTRTPDDEDIFNRSKEENHAIFGKYSLTDKSLGQGAYASVFRGFLRSNPEELVAIKSIRILKKPGFSEKLRREMTILTKFDHPNIVKLYDVAILDEKVFLFLEFCDGGDLSNKLTECGNILSEAEVMPIFKQLLEALRELYKNNIIHRDLKPANVLLKNNLVKLTDFGFAREVFTGMYEASEFTRLGTPIYMSPQILNSIPFSSKTDIWSLGIMIYEMLYGKTPWTGTTPQNLLKHILKTPLKFPEQMMNGYSNALVKKLPPVSNEMKELLKRMLEVTEEKRINWEEMFEHEIFKEKKIVPVIHEEKKDIDIKVEKKNESINIDNNNDSKNGINSLNNSKKLENNMILGEIHPENPKEKLKRPMSNPKDQPIKEKKKGFLGMFCCNP